MQTYEYVGNLHVHSSYSDGSGSIKEIAQAGLAAGIDFVVINDHYTLKALHNLEEKYYDKLLVLVGTEINKRCHHYLAMGVRKEVANNDTNPQKVIDEVNLQGGFGFIAHPFETGSPLFFKGKVYRWNDWSVTGYAGICVWNYCSQWRDGADTIPTASYTAFINPHWRIKGPCSQALSKIDELGQQRKIVMIGGTDAHAVKVNLKLTTYVVFPYQFLFRTVNTHIILSRPLIGSLNEDKKVVYNAIKEGASFIAFDYYHKANGFRFWIELQQGGKQILMGQEVQYKSGLVAKILVPAKAIIKLILNGNCIQEVEGTNFDVAILQKGVYRVEAYLTKKKIFKTEYIPWIFSNPIFLR